MNRLFARGAIVVALHLCLTNLTQAAQCTYTLLNQWPQGFTAAIKITNDGDQDIEGWSVSWQYTDGSSIIENWNSTLAGNNPYTATPVAYNTNIPVGQSIEFGFNANKGVVGQEAEIPNVSGSVCGDGATVFNLDTAKSSLYFASTKKIHVVESGTFAALSGDIKSTGKATLVVDLSTVDTSNTLRDQRMREFLFETNNYPSATVTLGVDLTSVNQIETGRSQPMDINATLDLHGVQVPIDTTVLVSKLTGSQIMVQNVSPLIINAADYNLVNGIEVLRDLVSVTVISYAVPVNFTLFFNAL